MAGPPRYKGTVRELSKIGHKGNSTKYWVRRRQRVAGWDRERIGHAQSSGLERKKGPDSGSDLPG